MNIVEPIQRVNIIRHFLQDDGIFPNNGLIPLIIYRGPLLLSGDRDAQRVVELFESNEWRDSWVDGIYDYHHYHSTAHEVLGAVRGSARVQFGGQSGIALLIEKGDVVVIPAGVAHKAVDLYDEFTCVGAYPDGQKYDIRTEQDDRETAMQNVKAVHLPTKDPLYGQDGPLISNWKV